jgi:hypothetical protein
VSWKAVLVDKNVGFTYDEVDHWSHQIAEDRRGNLYVAWIGADDLPRVSTSPDAGASWSRPIRFAAPDVKHSKLAPIAVG